MFFLGAASRSLAWPTGIWSRGVVKASWAPDPSWEVASLGRTEGVVGGLLSWRFPHGTWVRVDAAAEVGGHGPVAQGTYCRTWGASFEVQFREKLSKK